MSYSAEISFTKDNLDQYLSAVAKEYRKLGGRNVPAEIVLIGGASVLVNYGFREMTADVDALVHAATSMKEAVNRVTDRYGLQNGWLNSDFMRTASYTPKLIQHSVYYKTFSNVLTVRTITSEYLIAMKLRSGRRFKKDLSDVLGILSEHESRGMPITLDQIKDAVVELYGDWMEVPRNARAFIENATSIGQYQALYSAVTQEEDSLGAMLTSFEQSYPGVVTEDNADEILTQLQERASSGANTGARSSVLKKLRALQQAQATQGRPNREEQKLDRGHSGHSGNGAR